MLLKVKYTEKNENPVVIMAPSVIAGFKQDGLVCDATIRILGERHDLAESFELSDESLVVVDKHKGKIRFRTFTHQEWRDYLIARENSRY